MTIAGDLHNEAYRTGWDWAADVWDDAPAEERRAQFPRTEEQAPGVSYGRRLTDDETFVVKHFVHEAAQQKWTELYGASQSEGAKP